MTKTKMSSLVCIEFNTKLWRKGLFSNLMPHWYRWFSELLPVNCYLPNGGLRQREWRAQRDITRVIPGRAQAAQHLWLSTNGLEAQILEQLSICRRRQTHNPLNYILNSTFTDEERKKKPPQEQKKGQKGRVTRSYTFSQWPLKTLHKPHQGIFRGEIKGTINAPGTPLCFMPNSPHLSAWLISRKTDMKAFGRLAL